MVEREKKQECIHYLIHTVFTIWIFECSTCKCLCLKKICYNNWNKFASKYCMLIHLQDKILVLKS